MEDEVEVFWETPKHLFVRCRNYVVQVRGEELTVAALEAQETGLRLARARHRTGLLGALLVVEEQAPPATGKVAHKQRELVGAFAADERIYVSLVLEGAGVGVTLKRALARAVFRGSRRNICGSVREGAHWLANAMGDPSAEAGLVELVDSLRR